jgi:hypothetical protein
VAFWDAHPSGIVSLQSSSLNAAAAEVTTPPTIVVAVRGKRQRRLLQSEREGSAAEKMASPRACQRPTQPQISLLLNKKNWVLIVTTLLEVAASSRLRLRPSQLPLHPAQEDGPSGRLLQLAANVSPLVLKCLWIPIHPAPTDWLKTIPRQSHFPLEGIADLLENFPTNVCI